MILKTLCYAIAFVALLLFPADALASATSISITPDGQAHGACTTNLQTPAFFNNAASWGAGSAQIGAGTTVLLCGVFIAPDATNMFTVHGDGTKGNPIVVKWDTGAGIQSVRCPTIYNGNGPGCFSTGGHSYIVLDGGTNGFIKNTDTGQGFTQRDMTSGSGMISITGGTGVTVKNLTLGPIFTRYGTVDLTSIASNGTTATVTCAGPCPTAVNERIRISDYSNAAFNNTGCLNSANCADVIVTSVPDATHFTFASTLSGNATGGLMTDNTDFGSIAHNGEGAIYVTNSVTDLLIDHNVIHDCGWCVSVAVKGGAGFTVSNNEIYNFDHGLSPDSGSNYVIPSFVVDHNHFHDMQLWDTGPNNDFYHHDGIHAFNCTGGGIQDLTIANNVFDGLIGNFNITSWIFLEGNSCAWGPPTAHFHVFNNVVKGTLDVPGGLMELSSGGQGGKGHEIFNNTFLMTGTRNNGQALSLNLAPPNALVTIENNSFSGSPTSMTISGFTATIDYNAYTNIVAGGNSIWNSGAAHTNTFSAWQAAGFDTHGLDDITLPLPVDGTTYAPSASSVLVGAGLDLASLGNAGLDDDLAGNARPTTGNWTIGALDVGSSFSDGGASDASTSKDASANDAASSNDAASASDAQEEGDGSSGGGCGCRTVVGGTDARGWGAALAAMLCASLLRRRARRRLSPSRR